MSKYIIRNCKALISNDICGLYSQKGIHLSSYIYCKDKNCLLKQIVELCKGSIRENERDIYRAGRMSLAINILGLLDIQECE